MDWASTGEDSATSVCSSSSTRSRLGFLSAWTTGSSNALRAAHMSPVRYCVLEPTMAGDQALVSLLRRTHRTATSSSFVRSIAVRPAALSACTSIFACSCRANTHGPSPQPYRTRTDPDVTSRRFSGKEECVPEKIWCPETLSDTLSQMAAPLTASPVSALSSAPAAAVKSQETQEASSSAHKAGCVFSPRPGREDAWRCRQRQWLLPHWPRRAIGRLHRMPPRVPRRTGGVSGPLSGDMGAVSVNAPMEQAGFSRSIPDPNRDKVLSPPTRFFHRLGACITSSVHPEGTADCEWRWPCHLVKAFGANSGSETAFYRGLLAAPGRLDELILTLRVQGWCHHPALSGGCCCCSD